MTGGASGGGAFRAVSYNIHSGIGRDGLLDVGRIVSVLHETEADLIGLQEVGDWREGLSPARQFNDIMRRLDLEGVAGPTLSPGGDYGNALFTRWPIAERRVVDLSHGRREPRAAIDADVLVNGRPLRVIVTHLGLGPMERTAQIRRLADAIGNHRGPMLLLATSTCWAGRTASCGAWAPRQTCPVRCRSPPGGPCWRSTGSGRPTGRRKACGRTAAALPAGPPTICRWWPRCPRHEAGPVPLSPRGRGASRMAPARPPLRRPARRGAPARRGGCGAAREGGRPHA